MRRISTLLIIALFALVFQQGWSQIVSFEEAALREPLPIVFEQSPEYPWEVLPESSLGTCICSSSIYGHKTSWMQTTVTITETEATVSFDYHVSTHGEGECFQFVVDGQEILRVTSNMGDRIDKFSTTLSKGTHTLRWNYVLNGSYPDFRVYMKNLYITGFRSEKAFLSYPWLAKSYMQRLNSSSIDSIRIINLGKQKLTVTDVTGLSTPFEIKSIPAQALEEGDSAYIVYSFTPTSEDFFEQTLSFNTNGGIGKVKLHGVCTNGYGVESSTGQLAALVTNAQSDSLTVIGCLNNDDISFLKNNMPNLKYLNLAAAMINYNYFPDYAFNTKTSLKEVWLPANLSTVGYQAFDRCTSLSKVVFPQTIQTIREGAFSECNLIGELILPDSLKTIENYAFDYNEFTKIVLPLKVISIGYQAFAYCNELNELILNKALTSIDQHAFFDCFRLIRTTILAETPPSLQPNAFNYTKVFYVPKGKGSIYSDTENWKNLVIIDGDIPIKVSVTLAEAGTLGEEILKQLDYVNKVNELVITGPLNDDDFYQIQQRMPNLISIDMTETALESLPDYFFNNRGTLLDVKLPKILKVIGGEAFRDCSGLTSMVLPEHLTSIGGFAFQNCKSLTSINFPSSLTTIGPSAFSECYSITAIDLSDNIIAILGGTFSGCHALEKIKLPTNLVQIDSYAFNTCESLRNIEFPQTLRFLGYYAFGSCTGLQEIVLPASVQTCQIPFAYCHNIKKVTSLASVPPALDGSQDILYYVNKSGCELFVPFWSVNDYKLTDGWDDFPVINPLDQEVDQINIQGKLTLEETIRPKSQPSVYVFANGKFMIRGTEAFSMKKYTQSHRLEINDWWSENLGDNDRSTYTNLISESKGMRADSVIYEMSAIGGYWMYLSFPFDTKISDMEISDEALFAIRKYDGTTRAKGESVNWRDMTSDSTLRAGDGYIVQFNKNVSRIVLKAINNDNKNRLFSGVALSKGLGEYVSEFAHNRSWNFVGNPYPCYYDIRYMDFKSPITLWNGRGYTALSPEDDDYILRPMQAFFVQKPVGVNAINFLPEGRQMDASIRTRAITLRSQSSSKRTVYNLTFGNDEYKDKTRIVINPNMSMGYDITRDAGKFMSDEREVPQLYSLDASSTQYAINERPLGNGLVSLGVYIGKAGQYTFDLEPDLERNAKVILIDKLVGKQVRLDMENYSFTATPGSYDDRFEIGFNDVATGLEEGMKESATQVFSDNGQIHIFAKTGEEITVCNSIGQVQKTLNAISTSTVIPVEPGFYIVKVGLESFKIMVTK